MRIGIIRERKNPPDRRVVLSPQACQKVLKAYPEAEIIVEPSPIRVFIDEEYRIAGIPVEDRMEDCDVLLGVKEVPIAALIPNKKYFFFSHTIKKQPYNRDLLQAILNKDIEMYDHEVITDERNTRLVAFGRYAGIVGAYNGFRAFGLKHDLYEIPKAEALKDQRALIEVLRDISLPNVKILLTGKGRVGGGAMEMLKGMEMREVNVEEYLNETFDEPVFCQLEVLDYNKRKDGNESRMSDFIDHPEDFESDFMRFARVSDLFIAGHFYAEEAPYLFTRTDAKRRDFRISVVADISCDIDGPVASTIRPSTIAEPIYGYDPKLESEIDFRKPGAIAVMAVDNLPAELPRDASEGFGAAFVEHVIPSFFNGDARGILERARMTQNGELTERYDYLQDYVDGLE
ncbi:NAD(P)-dependent oxidoreductase [Zeaxanthinibacter sp. PT1]|uniref:NAD(P)-dependent oxidoreductase n=1 Tax=Zeaxanthinibacter TaxID=561554 RepID=UPI00234BBC6B|nr:NAD(P)-dependent oxidoreductase [Zeaxanthinibacter sp. PT1]MDC6352375.1 NAD(P)-dependent oxidoreductase [Zeaxanthinibacter sp. PT1]